MQVANREGFSLLEQIAVIAIVGLLAAIILPRLMGHNDSAQIATCHTYKGDIEIQVELWHHNEGSWPASNLATIGADLNYFPEGLPQCPVDGSSYTINTSTGLVIGHSH